MLHHDVLGRVQPRGKLAIIVRQLDVQLRVLQRLYRDLGAPADVQTIGRAVEGIGALGLARPAGEGEAHPADEQVQRQFLFRLGEAVLIAALQHQQAHVHAGVAVRVTHFHVGIVPAMDLFFDVHGMMPPLNRGGAGLFSRPAAVYSPVCSLMYLRALMAYSSGLARAGSCSASTSSQPSYLASLSSLKMGS